MSIYTDAVEHNLKGLEAVSTGACPGCAECADEHGFRDTEDDAGNITRTAVEAFTEAYEAGEVVDEGGFSWHECGICGSTFGGDRYSWHAIDAKSKRLYHFTDACVDCLFYLVNGDEPEGWQRHPTR